MTQMILIKTSIKTFKLLTCNIISHQRFYLYPKTVTWIWKIFLWFILTISENSRIFFLKQALFKVLCLTETWFDDRSSKSWLYQLPQYVAIHQHKSPSHKSGRGGRISMYIYDSMNFKFRRDLDINTIEFYQ